ncbi:hypothetical protein Tco_1344246 [Tanacetum coccineum]
MPPRKTPRTRTTPATETTTTTSVTNAQLKALIEQGVADDLAARDTNRSMNGDDSHNSGTGVRRTERVAREPEEENDWTSYCLGRDEEGRGELWNLKVKGTNVIGYNQRFQEPALMCVRIFPEESNKIKRYVGVKKQVI